MDEEEKKEEQAITITYETLFDILRMEKRREDLQELQKTFFQDVVHYLKQKKEILIKKEHESGIDRVDEVKKLTIQYENIQKILKEIYERRERKILLMALNKSRTRMNMLNVDVLLPQEYEFYEQLIRLLDAYRGDVAEKVIKGFLPKQQIAAVMGSLHHTEHREQRSEILQSSDNQKNEGKSDKESPVQVKFLQETEEFVGPELEVYGPFDANSIAVLPAKLASTFISTGIAEEVK
jgi:DNA replication initiation complex subunit (GINS family)